MPKLILGRVHVFVQHMILLEFQSALISRQNYLVSFPFSSIHSNHVYLSWFTENDMKTLIQLNPSYSSLPNVTRRDMSRTVTTRTTNLAELHRQNVNRTDRLIRPILHLQDHSAALQSPQRMPLASWNIQRTNRSAS